MFCTSEFFPDRGSRSCCGWFCFCFRGVACIHFRVYVDKSQEEHAEQQEQYVDSFVLLGGTLVWLWSRHGFRGLLSILILFLDLVNAPHGAVVVRNESFDFHCGKNCPGGCGGYAEA